MPSLTMATRQVEDHLVVDDDEKLASLGYQPELKRSFSALGMIGFSFSIVTCWTALGGVLVAGISAGGPPVMIWGWVGISLFSLAIAYSLAEMCSEYPVAGGQYSWVYILSPRSIRRPLSYITGWFMIIGLLAMGATNASISADFILGMVNLNNQGYEIQRWHTVLLSWSVIVLQILINLNGERLLNHLSKGILFFNVVGLIITIATILACNDHKQSASFVFAEFQNTTGFGGGMACIIGLLQPAFGMCCYEAPAHMTEEIRDADRKAPLAIITAVWVGALTGFIFLVSICFCIGDITSVTNSSTGSPLIQIFFDSTASILGTSFLAAFQVVISIGSGNALLAEGSRSLYAFARDNGLPFSKTIARINTRLHVPVIAIFIAASVEMAFCAIYFGTTTGFNTIIAIATQGFYLSYSLPLLARLLHHYTTSKSDSALLSPSAPWTMSRRTSILTNSLGLLYLCFACITFNFPSTCPVTPENMNYTSAAMGIIMVLAGGTWIMSARRTFSGPELNERVLEGLKGGIEVGEVGEMATSKA